MSHEKEMGYIPLTEPEFQIRYEKHENIIRTFLENSAFPAIDYQLELNRDLIMEIIKKIHQRELYFDFFHELQISEFKEIALIAFWYIKLHPITIIKKNPSVLTIDSVNEKLAVYYIVSGLRALLKLENKPETPLDNLPKSYLDEVVYTFTYRDITKEALILLVGSMGALLGLNPYKPE